VQNPKPFTVFQPTHGQSVAKPLFTVYAYSLAQERALVAAMASTICRSDRHHGDNR
jgi:hypothetical protein